MPLVCLGDSLTEGRYGGDWVAAAAKRLPSVTFSNAGSAGQTVINLLRRVDALIESEPDGVIVIVGGNDAISYSQPATRPYYAQVQKLPEGYVSAAQFRAAYRELLTRLQAAYVPTWVGLPPIEYNPAVAATLAAYNALARAEAEQLRVPVLDLAAHLGAGQVVERPPLDLRAIQLIGQRVASGWADYAAEQVRGGYAFTFDGLHLTPEAAERVGAFVAHALSRDSR